MRKNTGLRGLPSVDVVLKDPSCEQMTVGYPRRFVVDAVREAIDLRRKSVLSGAGADLTIPSILSDVSQIIEQRAKYSLKKVINATGIVIHTNLGRSVLSKKAVKNIADTASGYSNLEYDLKLGMRGKRHTHLKRILADITGAEDGFAVNNNAAAVLLSLSALARGREVIVSRAELVEIGGSFRVPDVMAQSGAVLKEVGTTNKTRLSDYENAISENTGMILKVHQSNYRITGFTEETSIESLVALGKSHGIPVMHDLGSGSLINLSAYGISGEPSVQDIVKTGADVICFSGDKLLGGPQAGIIVGNRIFTDALQKHPLARALRIDKLTLAGLEATLMQYADEQRAVSDIPTLHMLLSPADNVKRRCQRLVRMLQKMGMQSDFEIVKDSAFAGGGALPEYSIPTYAIRVKPKNGLSPDEFQERLSSGTPPVIGRIKDGWLLLDMRTVADSELKIISRVLSGAIKG